ncbi:MAG: hypothetical protein ACJ746_09840 [Bryobacteraceae bacterium]
MRETAATDANWYLKLTFASFMWATSTCPIQAQSPVRAPSAGTEEEIQLLKAEVIALRTELNSLKEELHRNAPATVRSSYSGSPLPDPAHSGSVSPPQASPLAASNRAPQSAAVDMTNGAEPQSDIADTVSLIQSQVAEQAQTKVESSSKMPVKIYGTILSTTFFNTRDTDWADVPILVNTRSVFNSGWFSSSLRQSRVGLEVNGPTIGSFKSTGVFAMDFMGGMTDFQATPLFGLPSIVYAYARFENAKTAIEAGQDEVILAPRNPTSLVAFSYPELYRTGNLYLRAPQVRLERQLATSKQGQLRATLGLVAPIGTYPTLDFPGGSVTNGWKRPAVQARIAWQSAPPGGPDQPGWAIGISGHYGRVMLPQVNSSEKVVSSFSSDSWAGAVDLDLHSRHVGFDAEGYIGKNLQSLGGGIGQPGKTAGGYFEGRFMATRRLQLNAGLGDDHLTKPDRISVLLNRNTAFFANTIFQFTPEIHVSLEYRHMITMPFDGVKRRNENVNLGLAYSF